MAVQRLGGLAGFPALLGVVPGVASAQGTDAQRRSTDPERAGPPVVLGLMADVGVPDGVNAALALRPVPWLRLHAGGGTNTVSAGYRGGLTLLVPAVVSPSFSVEVGHFRDGDANGLVRRFVGGQGVLEPLLARFGYTYINSQFGLEIGSGPVQFFIHAGVSRITATVHNASAALESAQAGQRDPQTTVTLREEPVVRVWAPSVKMGLIVYLGGS
jgi:hypothetical protein